MVTYSALWLSPDDTMLYTIISDMTLVFLDASNGAILKQATMAGSRFLKNIDIFPDYEKILVGFTDQASSPRQACWMIVDFDTMAVEQYSRLTGNPGNYDIYQ